MKKEILIKELNDISELVENLLGDSSPLTMVKDIKKIIDNIDSLVISIEDEEEDK